MIMDLEVRQLRKRTVSLNLMYINSRIIMMTSARNTCLISFNLVCWSLIWVQSNSQARRNKIIYLPNVDLGAICISLDDINPSTLSYNGLKFKTSSSISIATIVIHTCTWMYRPYSLSNPRVLVSNITLRWQHYKQQNSALINRTGLSPTCRCPNGTGFLLSPTRAWLSRRLSVRCRIQKWWFGAKTHEPYPDQPWRLFENLIPIVTRL
jgi:hypothetical protein